jgi:hypothetical protein
MDALRKGLKEIETILNDIKATGKLDYLRKEHDNFSRVIHDYADIKSGFTAWKCIIRSMLTTVSDHADHRSDDIDHPWGRLPFRRS